MTDNTCSGFGAEPRSELTKQLVKAGLPAVPVPGHQADVLWTAERWDDLDGAIQALMVAQPYQMTEAASRVEAARMAMRSAITSLLSAAAKRKT